MTKYVYFVLDDLESQNTIKKKLKNYHISIKDVASQCDCNPSYVYNMLKGLRPVSYNFNEFLISIGINLEGLSIEKRLEVNYKCEYYGK